MKHRIITATIILSAISAFFTYKFIQESPTFLTPIFIAAIALPTIIGLWKSLKWRGLALFLALGAFACAIETIGIITGFPYGEFTYSNALGAKLFGTTPFPVFFAWSPLVFGSLALAQITTKKITSQFLLALALLITTDLILDPGSVALGFWTWKNPGAYYGVPLINYLGWIISGSIGIAIAQAMQKHHEHKRASASTWIILPLLFSIYFWTAINILVTNSIPAILGIVFSVITTVLFYKKI